MRHFSVSFFLALLNHFSNAVKNNRLILCDSHNRCYFVIGVISTIYDNIFVVVLCFAIVIAWLIFLSILICFPVYEFHIYFNIAWEILWLILWHLVCSVRYFLTNHSHIIGLPLVIFLPVCNVQWICHINVNIMSWLMSANRMDRNIININIKFILLIIIFNGKIWVVCSLYSHYHILFGNEKNI